MRQIAFTDFTLIMQDTDHCITFQSLQFVKWQTTNRITSQIRTSPIWAPQHAQNTNLWVTDNAAVSSNVKLFKNLLLLWLGDYLFYYNTSIQFRDEVTLAAVGSSNKVEWMVECVEGSRHGAIVHHGIAIRVVSQLRWFSSSNFINNGVTERWRTKLALVDHFLFSSQ